jgi:predicted nucleic acid-binding protein
MPLSYVIDASVAAKWILPEPDSDVAMVLLEQADARFHVPELCTAELANVLWKRSRRGEISSLDAVEAAAQLRDLPVRRHSHQTLITPALLIALQHGITVYDALYVALALSLDATVITADRTLAGARTSGDDWPVQVLEEWSE